MHVKELLCDGRTGEAGSMEAAQLLTAGCARALSGDAVLAGSAWEKRQGLEGSVGKRGVHD